MATRSVAWRRSCPDEVSRCFEESARLTLYIVHQTGPTGFILKQDGIRKKVKVLLGDPHMCSCSAFKKTRELCVHIVWVLLKKFRIPRVNPVVWQLGLIQREITEILRGYLTQQIPSSPSHPSPSSPHTLVPQKEIGPDDVCPICQDDLLNSSRRVTYCQRGCGKSVHVKCIKIWAEHQKKTTPTNTGGESKPLPCPLCRGDFGSIPLTETRQSHLTGLELQRQHCHLGVTCHHCHVCPIMGKCYQCCICASYHLCHACFSNNQIHPFHSFLFRQHSEQPWRAVPHPSTATGSTHFVSTPLPSTLAGSLQSRSLSEADYDLLLSLDSVPGPSTPPQRSRPHGEGVAERVVTSLHVEPLDGHHPLVVGGACCHLCRQGYVRGDWIKKLPCKHKFHRGCVEEWLQDHATCPIDNHPIMRPAPRRNRHAPQPPGRGNPSSVGLNRTTAPLTRARLVGGVSVRSCDQDPGGMNVEISVAGRGLGGELAGKNQTTAKTSSRSLPSLFKTAPDVMPPLTGTTPPQSHSLVATALKPLVAACPFQRVVTARELAASHHKSSLSGRLRKGTVMALSGGAGSRKNRNRVVSGLMENSLHVSRFQTGISSLT